MRGLWANFKCEHFGGLRHHAVSPDRKLPRFLPKRALNDTDKIADRKYVPFWGRFTDGVVHPSSPSFVPAVCGDRATVAPSEPSNQRLSYET